MHVDASEFAAVAIPDHQLTPWPRVAAVSAMVSFSLPTFITGLEISHGLSPVQASGAIILGSLIIFLIGAVMGAIGAMTRMSSYLLVRIAFGDRGAGLVNIAFAISLLGWFGVNINLFTDALSRLAEDLWRISLSPTVLAFAASVCMTSTTLIGFRAINILASLMAPVLAVVTFLLISSTLSANALGDIMQIEKASALTFGQGFSAIVGAIIVGAIILPDITRFIRHWSGAIYTVILSYLVVQVVVLCAAALAGAASGKTDILDIMLDLQLGLGAFLIVIAGSWVLNSLNLYSTILSVKATFTELNSTILAFGLGGVGFLAALLNILDSFVTFLFYLSVIFIPVAGVIVIDYAIIRRAAYRIENLNHNRAYNAPGLAAWAIGALFAVLAAENLAPTLTGVGALDAVFLSGAVYSALSWRNRQPGKAVRS